MSKYPPYPSTATPGYQPSSVHNPTASSYPQLYSGPQPQPQPAAIPSHHTQFYQQPNYQNTSHLPPTQPNTYPIPPATTPHLPHSQVTTHLPPQSDPHILPQSNINFSQPNSRRPLQTNPHISSQTQLAHGMENMQIKPVPHNQNLPPNRYSLELIY